MSKGRQRYSIWYLFDVKSDIFWPSPWIEKYSFEFMQENSLWNKNILFMIEIYIMNGVMQIDRFIIGLFFFN